MEKTKKILVVMAALVFTTILSVSASAQQGPEGNGFHSFEPSQEAVSACLALNEGESCNFSTQDGQSVIGSCATMQSQLLCLPSEHSGQGHKGRRGNKKGGEIPLLVDSAGVAYVVSQDSVNGTTSLTGIDSSGEQIEMVFDGHVHTPVMSDDGTLLVTGAVNKTEGTSILYLISTPVSDGQTPVEVLFEGEIASRPVIKNNQVYVVTVIKGESGTDNQSYLYIIGLDGTVNSIVEF